ncbi:hypothetical protein [Actinacidiphila glaucinigra]|uniref:Uncharacterized protein n=1 Tax=Actinacidiphila glaucinigra TaxID=235986 RepID=A0A239MRR1_9ACTN|nr:hypothetical protein [Actinacidiphila glaucinigra]SNT44539.1 hypothetical protein SAMN05216252_12629 [Actinacidiphila glaucinigra]
MRTTAVPADLLGSATAGLLDDFRTGVWQPSVEERDLADGLAPIRWSEESLRASLRDLPQAVADGRLCTLFVLVVQVIAPAPGAASDGTLLQVRVLIDALTPPLRALA